MSFSSVPSPAPAAKAASLRAQIARLGAENEALRARNRELSWAELRLNCLMQSENFGVLIGDASGAIAQVNQTFARMVGHEREQLIGAPDLWHYCALPEEVERHRQKSELLWREGVCPPWETAFLRPDGSRLPVLTGAALVDESPGEAESVGRTLLIWALDISERARAETELRVSENRMRAIVECLHDGLLITDLDDTITYANGRISEMSGYSNAELVGHKAYEVLGDPELWELCRERNREREVGASGSYELPLRRKDGATCWALINGSPLRDAEGAIVGTIGAHFDITQRKHDEAELSRFAGRLELSNRDLEAFAYAVSHDLKEPLRKIEIFGGCLNDLEGAHMTPEGHAYLARMRNAARRMSGLIDGLLLYSRAATRSDGWDWIALDDAAREALLDVELAIEHSGARVEVGPLPQIYADATQMRQLLQNLIGNALKYRREDVAPQVRVVGWESDGICHLEIADNGRGFAPRDAEAIFEIFRRAPAATVAPNQAPTQARVAELEAGAGVGLTICRKIVERHRGRIRAQSMPGQGATFRVEIPIGPATRGADVSAI